MLRSGLATLILVAAAVGMLPASQAVLIEDFETGAGAWMTNDGGVAGAKPAKLCGIYTTSDSAPGGGQQAGMIEFLEGKSTWASVTIDINGQTWAQNNCTELSMWLRGDGSDSEVSVVLRAFYNRPHNPDVAYSQPVSLRGTQWRKLGLRFLGFKDKDGQTLTRDDLLHLTLLQFVKAGSWEPCRFYVDELRAESKAGPIVSQQEVLELDFRRWSGAVRTQIGCNFGAAGAAIEASLEAQDTVGSVIRGLAPCVVRFVLDDYLRRDQEQYDIIRLNQHVNFIQRQGAKALICLHSPPTRPGDEAQKGQGLRQVFRATVRRLVTLRAGEPWGRYYELLSQPLLQPDLVTTYDVINAYNLLADQIIQADPDAWIGGPGLASPWEEHLSGFVGGANRLDFLSYHFWGAHTPVADAAQLLSAARTGQSPDLPGQLSFEVAGAQARWQRRPPPEVFATQTGLNSATPSAGQPTSEYFTGSWLAMAALAAAPYIDKLLYTPLSGDKVGFVDEEGQASAVYQAAWLVRTYMPRGSKLCHWLYPDDETIVAAIRTATANNVVIAYGGEGQRVFAIKVKQAGKLALARARKVDPSAQQIQFLDLPLATQQTIELAGPGVAVVQFIQ